VNQQHLGWGLIALAGAMALADIADAGAKLPNYQAMFEPAFVFGVVLKHGASAVVGVLGGTFLRAPKFGGPAQEENK
jgi:hypothetical protein